MDTPALVQFLGLRLRASPTTGTTLQMHYTFTNAQSATPTIGDNFFGVLGISKHMLTAVASHWINKKLNITFDVLAASEYSLSPYGARGRRMLFTGPMKADLVVRYVFPRSFGKQLDVFVKGENILNQRPYENGFLGPGTWATGGLRIMF